MLRRTPPEQHGTFATLQWAQAPVEQGQEWQGERWPSPDAVVKPGVTKPGSNNGETAQQEYDVPSVVQSESGRHSGQQQRQRAFWQARL